MILCVAAPRGARSDGFCCGRAVYVSTIVQKIHDRIALNKPFAASLPASDDARAAAAAGAGHCCVRTRARLAASIDSDADGSMRGSETVPPHRWLRV